MRTSFVALLSVIASAAAYQVISPSAATKWYGGSVTNTLTWERVATDAEQFTLVLVNENRALLPVNNQQLLATVPGSAGTIEVPAPSGGFPVGTGFRVNMVQSPTNVTTIYAQSPEFEIVSGTPSSTGSVTASATPRSITMVASVAPAGSSTSSAAPLNETGSPSANGVMSVVARASPVVAAGAILAAFLA